MYPCSKKWHWVERTYKATVIASRLRHSLVVQLYYLLRLWLYVLRLLGSLRTSKTCLCIGQIEASTCPPGHTPGIWHLCRPGEKGIWLSESSKGWGIWSPCFRGGEFELQPRFHVNLWRGEHWGARCYRIFVEKIVPLWPIGYEEKAYTSFVAYWKNLNFKLFKYWIQALNVWM